MQTIIRVCLSFVIVFYMFPLSAYAACNSANTSIYVAENEPATAEYTEKATFLTNEMNATNNILVTVAESMTKNELKDELLEIGVSLAAESILSFTSDENIDLYETVAVAIDEQANINDEIKKVSSLNNIVYVEPDIIIQTNSTNVNDEFSSMDATEQNYWLNMVHAYDSWDLSKTEHKISIAVIDSGFDIEHEDLVTNLNMEYAYDVTNHTRGSVAESKHGTHVAGICAAMANNEIGIAGASYNADIIPISIFSGNFTTFSEIIEALRYVSGIADEANIRVVNMSLGGEFYSYGVQQLITRLSEKNITVVCAAGNTGNTENTVEYPAAYDKAISVSAVNSSGKICYFSTHNGFVDIAAPGSNILSCVPYDENGEDQTKYSRLSGTSMAAPIVSGIVALIYSLYPELTADEVETVLAISAQDVGDQGYDEKYGNGIIDAVKALQVAKNKYINTISLSNVRISSLTVGQTEEISVAAKSGTPCYAVSMNKEVATAEVIDDKVIITAIGKGHTVIRIMNDGNNQYSEAASQAIDVTIVPNTNTISTSTSVLNMTPQDTATIYVNDLGNSELTLTSTNNSVIEAKMNGNKIIVNAIAVGKAELTISTEGNNVYGSAKKTIKINIIEKEAEHQYRINNLTLNNNMIYNIFDISFDFSFDDIVSMDFICEDCGNTITYKKTDCPEELLESARNDIETIVSYTDPSQYEYSVMFTDFQKMGAGLSSNAKTAMNVGTFLGSVAPSEISYDKRDCGYYFITENGALSDYGDEVIYVNAGDFVCYTDEYKYDNEGYIPSIYIVNPIRTIKYESTITTSINNCNLEEGTIQKYKFNNNGNVLITAENPEIAYAICSEKDISVYGIENGQTKITAYSPATAISYASKKVTFNVTVEHVHLYNTFTKIIDDFGNIEYANNWNKTEPPSELHGTLFFECKCGETIAYTSNECPAELLLLADTQVTPHKYKNQIILSTKAISIQQGETITIEISNTNGTANVISNNKAIAEAIYDGNTITVTGISQGTTTISLFIPEDELYEAVNESITVNVIDIPQDITNSNEQTITQNEHSTSITEISTNDEYGSKYIATRTNVPNMGDTISFVPAILLTICLITFTFCFVLFRELHRH